MSLPHVIGYTKTGKVNGQQSLENESTESTATDYSREACQYGSTHRGMGKNKPKQIKKKFQQVLVTYFSAAPVHTCAPVPAVEFRAVTSLECVNVSNTGTQRGDTTVLMYTIQGHSR